MDIDSSVGNIAILKGNTISIDKHIHTEDYARDCVDHYVEYYFVALVECEAIRNGSHL